MAECKYCGAEIVWVKMKSGKKMPCDPMISTYTKDPKGKLKIITTTGEVVSCSPLGDSSVDKECGYIPHWSTCPNADRYRNKKVE